MITLNLKTLSNEELEKLKQTTINDIAKYKNYQLAKKVQLNSAYGAIANRFFRYYNIKNASAITVSGQLSTMWIEKKINELINNILKTKNVDYVIAADTDSVYVNMGPLVKSSFDGVSDKERIVDFLDKVSKEKFEPFMAKSYEELAMRMNAYENAMKMKREAIADRGIWKAKKMYILNLYDNEGVRYSEPKLKIMGIEAVRSSTPSSCRESIKSALKVIMSKTNDDLIEFIDKFRKNFNSLSFEEIAFPRGVNGIEKYKDPVTMYKKGTPIHVKASIVYNDLIKKNGLDQKFPLIYDRDKIKFAYLKMPNRAKSPVIAVPAILPKELGLETFINYDLQFEKSFLEPIKAIVNAIGWVIEKHQTLDNFFE